MSRKRGRRSARRDKDELQAKIRQARLEWEALPLEDRMRAGRAYSHSTPGLRREESHGAPWRVIAAVPLLYLLLYVATLDGENRVVLKSVTIARDNGSTVEIAAGLAPADRVIETPPDGVVAGSAVRVVGEAANP